MADDEQTETPPTTPARRRPRKTAAAPPPEPAVEPTAEGAPPASDEPAPPRKRTRRKAAEPAAGAPAGDAPTAEVPAAAAPEPAAPQGPAVPAIPVPIFQPPEPAEAPPPRRRRPRAEPAADAPAAAEAVEQPEAQPGPEAEAGSEEAAEGGTGRRRRRGRRGRGGGRGAAEGEIGAADGAAESESEPGAGGDADATEAPAAAGEAAEGAEEEGTGTRRRRRRGRGRGGAGSAAETGETERPRDEAEPEIRGVRGSTRLEAKRQRRREGRESRRRPPILTEAEFLARREAVERVMVVREGADRTQIGVLEDGVLVEHYITRPQQTSAVGNVYLGRVQNVLPSMEAAFVDIGKGRNAVLYAGEVNYDASALEGRPQRIEQALKSGQSVLVQVTKDPIAHKGARLTSQVSLPGRYMVYVPEGRMTGISRKLPDSERTRLKSILKRLLPDDAGLIVRTAAEGATEEELTRDLSRLRAQWEDIQVKAASASPPALVYGEPDLVIRVIRDIFNEDFTSLVVQGEDEWDMVEAYISHVAPDLRERVSRWTGSDDLFAHHRVDEQLAKALDRKVWLPSGGYLIIDRTEAMTVIDVNTGKFTGSGGNLEETVTKNNLEAAEEIVRQLRLRDIGGIIVVDFIDMVLESNRELVLRRLVECLGRDRTRHQVAEVTSLGLVQMTRKRIGQGLLEAFSQTCPECNGRGVKVLIDPFVPPAPARHGGTPAPEPPRRRGSRARQQPGAAEPAAPVTPATVADTG